MPHYEAITFIAMAESVRVFGEEQTAFGCKKIIKRDDKTLLEKPDQPNETPIQTPAETIKFQQTLFPNSPAFSDFGDSHSFINPSPNDSIAYDGLQNLYFERNSLLERKDAVDELKKKDDDARQQIHEKEEEISHQKALVILYSL